jgi:hypothetical protein
VGAPGVAESQRARGGRAEGAPEARGRTRGPRRSAGRAAVLSSSQPATPAGHQRARAAAGSPAPVGPGSLEFSPGERPSGRSRGRPLTRPKQQRAERDGARGSRGLTHHFDRRGRRLVRAAESVGSDWLRRKRRRPSCGPRDALGGGAAGGGEAAPRGPRLPGDWARERAGRVGGKKLRSRFRDRERRRRDGGREEKWRGGEERERGPRGPGG